MEKFGIENLTSLVTLMFNIIRDAKSSLRDGKINMFEAAKILWDLTPAIMLIKNRQQIVEEINDLSLDEINQLSQFVGNNIIADKIASDNLVNLSLQMIKDICSIVEAIEKV
jgi:hypothetical protein